MTTISSDYRITNPRSDAAVSLSGNPSSGLNPPEFSDAIVQLNQRDLQE